MNTKTRSDGLNSNIMLDYLRLNEQPRHRY